MATNSYNESVFKSWPFFAIMKGAAALSLIRGLILAIYLSKEEFAGYSVIVATGYFLGYLLSFGSVEGTIKKFPRLVIAGNAADMILQANALVWQLIIRATILGLSILLLGIIFSSEKTQIFSTAALFALAASSTSVIASVQRAVGESNKLAASNVARALLTFGLVVPAAFEASLSWVLIAEVLAALIGFIVSCRISGIKIWPASGWKSFTTRSSNDGKELMISGGGFVTLTYVVLSIPFYLDRLYVTAIYSIDDAAKYSLMALYLTVAVLIFNSIGQRVGAEVIKITTELGQVAAMKFVGRWTVFGVGAWLFFIISIALITELNWIPATLSKYEINIIYLLPLTALGSLAITGLLEFLLMAADMEKKMFFSALIYLTLIAGVAFLIWVFDASLLYFLWGLVFARIIYLSLLCVNLSYKKLKFI